jgi:molybdenum cofactor biosynthesis protein B
MIHNELPFVPLRVAVLTVSDSRTLASDTSGEYLCAQLNSGGHEVVERKLIPDDIYQVRAVVSAWIADPHIGIVITTGGTGLTGRDGTPEAVQPLLDKTIEGFGELFRYLSYSDIGTSTVQSRALGGVANQTYLFCLPGSTGACRLAWEKILSLQLDSRHRPCNFAELIPRLKE